MNTIYWRMNATQGGANLHPGVNLLPGANLHPGANCAHEHGFRHFSLHVFKRGYDCACAMIGHSSCFYGILK